MSAPGQPSVTPERIMQMAWGYAAPLMIEAAVRHRIFDLVDGGATTPAQVAALAGTSERAVRIVMNALAGVQLMTKDAEGHFRLAADTAAFLVSGKPGFLGGLSRHTSTRTLPMWMKLGEVLQTGKPATGGVDLEQVGTEFFQGFVADLFPLSYRPAQMLADALNLPAAQKPVRVLDLAAGSGVWGIAMAQKSPQVSVTAMDWAGVLDVTRNMAARFGVAERFSFVAADIQTAEFGSGYDIAMLGHILHMEGEQRSRALVRKTFEALAPGGTVAIAEFLVNDDRTSPPMGLIFAVNMLVATEEGDTFSFNEIAGWLRDAGFEDVRIVDTPGPSPVILATRPA
jgi:2-polyprenyl-3-methyl-5-hydroxy-6-metoxy-1,4-benzoquinol methylase